MCDPNAPPAPYTTETRTTTDGMLLETVAWVEGKETVRITRRTHWEWDISVGPCAAIAINLSSKSPIVAEFTARKK